MLSDAQLYSEHRSMQIRDTDLFLRSVVDRMDWSSPDRDLVMDVGCGPGNSCRRAFLPHRPEIGRLLAVDVLPDMIEFARENNAHEKIEYHVADIEDRNSIERWSQQISKIFSIYCFNWLTNQRAAFENIFHLLKPGGEAALVFVLTTPFWDSYELHYKNPKYSKYLKNINPRVPESHFKKQGASFYRCMLQDIGFDIILCEEEKRTYSYPDDDDCRAASYSRSGLTSYIPEELKADFKEDVFQGFLKYNGRDSEGRPLLNYTALSLLLQKPRA